MASWVLSECGLKPLPQIFNRPRNDIVSRAVHNPSKPIFLNKGRPCFSDLKLSNEGFRERKWGIQVSAPLRVALLEGEANEAKQKSNNVEEQPQFNPGAPPKFKLADIRAAIPKYCWVKNPWKSMSYVARDVAIVFGLAATVAYLNNWFAWPLYWAAQGTMFWALFVLGHDWRISHRTHHQNHGHVENDESWHPLPEKTFKSLDESAKTLRFKAPFPMLAYPFYLWSRSPGKSGSHFDPKSDLFVLSEKKDVITSTTCWLAMAALLAGSSFVMGPIQMLKLYGVPYWIFVMWLDFITYLHHHGHVDKLPWYRGKEWSYLRGGLTTLDRDYGVLNNIHHDICTHVIHHLFPQIPHYHLIEATEAARPVLGKYYREPKKSGPLPFHLIGELLRSLKKDHYVSDTGEIVYYETDPQILGKSK